MYLIDTIISLSRGIGMGIDGTSRIGMVHMRAHKHQFAYTCILFAPLGDHLCHLLYTKGGW